MTPFCCFPADPLLRAGTALWPFRGAKKRAVVELGADQGVRVAPLAGSLINAAITTKQIESLNAAAIATAAVAVQGTGFLISFMICSAFLYRLMTQKLPRDTQRPGVVSRPSVPPIRGSYAEAPR